MGVTQLFQDSDTVGNPATTIETDLHTFTMPGGTLAADGDAVMVYSLVFNANTGNNKRTILRFGATVIGDSTSLAVTNNWWWVQAIITRTSATTQKALCWVGNVANGAAWNTAAGGNINSTTPAEDLSGAVVIRVTGASPVAGAANDVQVFLTVMVKIPAP